MKNSAFAILLVLTFVLSGLGSSPVAAAQADSGSGLAGATGQNAVGNLSAQVEYRFLVGTIKLEGTDLAVTAKQARMLLPLWRQIRSSSQDLVAAQGQGGAPANESGNSAIQKKIDALVQKIQAALTAGQVKAINNMHITLVPNNTTQAQAGIIGGANYQPPTQVTPAPPVVSGQVPQGTSTPPAGNGQAQPGNGQPALQDTAQAGSSSVSPQMIDPLIRLLQNLVSGAPAQATPSNMGKPAGR